MCLNCLIQGWVGLNEQELEMQSILVRLQQVFQITFSAVKIMEVKVFYSVFLQEVLKATMHSRHRPETKLQEQQQVGIIFSEPKPKKIV